MSLKRIRLKFYGYEILKCLLMGLFIGVLTALYKYAVELVLYLSGILFTINDLPSLGVGLVTALSLLFIGYYMLMSEGAIQGTGLAQLELNIAYNQGTIKWYKALPMMFINSLISFFVGIPVGKEGPIVFMGGTVAIGLKRFFKSEDHEDVALGMGAGFGSAFISPLSGVAYTFEEGLEKFSFFKLLKAIIICFIAALTSYAINPEFVYQFNLPMGFNWATSYTLILIFLVELIVAYLLLKGMKYVKIFINKHYQNFFIKYRYFFIYLFSIIILIIFPLISGSGLKITDAIFSDDSLMALYWVVILILLYRLVIFVIAGNSMASGGHALPILTIGALVAKSMTFLFHLFPNYDITQDYLIIVLGMTTLFAMMNNAPWTSFFLTLSFGGLSNLLTTIFPALIMMIAVYIYNKFKPKDNIIATLRKLLKTSNANKIDH